VGRHYAAKLRLSWSYLRPLSGRPRSLSFPPINCWLGPETETSPTTCRWPECVDWRSYKLATGIGTVNPKAVEWDLSRLVVFPMLLSIAARGPLYGDSPQQRCTSIQTCEVMREKTVGVPSHLQA